jgi:hypothetical protein
MSEHAGLSIIIHLMGSHDTCIMIYCRDRPKLLNLTQPRNPIVAQIAILRGFV